MIPLFAMKQSRQSLFNDKRKSDVALRRFSRGFTLIEVMNVIALIGLIVTSIQFSATGNKADEKLKQASAKFAAIFTGAVEYGLLNNIELGLKVEKNHYQFLGYNGVKWSEIPEQTWLTSVQLPEEVELTLTLDDLPIEEPLLFDSTVFTQDEEDFTLESKEDKEKKLLPQVYLLSGGDMTPFSLTFSLSPTFASEKNSYYRVTGLYTVPLTVEGPLYDK